MAGPVPHWLIITPEYPPSPGGVADYTHLLARELAARGHRVEVFAPAPATGAHVPDPGIECHSLRGRFGGEALRQLDEALAGAPKHAVVLVQYVPSGFGARSMNLRFAWWLGRRRHTRLWLMVHEAAFPFVTGISRYDLLAIANRAMLVASTMGAERVFASTPAWEPVLNRWDLGRHPVEWLPVPASIPHPADMKRAKTIRSELALTPNQALLGHFGTYARLVAEPLARVVELARERDPNLVWLMLGRGSTEFVHQLPSNANAVAKPDLEPQAVADNLAALDLVTLPFPDGISARRTSAMAALAVGTPIVTTEGHNTESVWRLTRAVALCGQHAETVAASAISLARDAVARRELSVRGLSLYRERFEVGRLADTLIRLV
jgi:glycosyltransferase involved in cell wall biosynthesis